MKYLPLIIGITLITWFIIRLFQVNACRKRVSKWIESAHANDNTQALSAIKPCTIWNTKGH